MSKLVVKAALLKLNNIDYSAQVESAELDIDAPEVDMTNMASGGWKELLSGVKAGTLAITWKKDADLSALESYLWTNLGLLITFEIALVNTGRTTTNPSYTGSVLVTKHTPVA